MASLQRLARLALLMLSMAAAAAQARDPNDAEKTADHPQIARFPGFHIDNAKRHDYNEHLFATRGYDGDGEPKGDVKAGKYWFIDYCLNEDARQPSSIELVRNYENAVRKAGGVLVIRNAGDGEPQSAVYRMPLPGGGERWVQLDINNDGVRYQLAIVEVGAMTQKLEFSAGQMAEEIRRSGHVALSGILFDTAKATIKPESQSLLNEVLGLLQGDKALRLAIEGHTDNVGDAKANLDLSRRRAEAVVDFLVGRGVAAQRLKPVGKGAGVPVADNRSEEGRARNRRVELVKL